MVELAISHEGEDGSNAEIKPVGIDIAVPQDATKDGSGANLLELLNKELANGIK